MYGRRILAHILGLILCGALLSGMAGPALASQEVDSAQETQEAQADLTASPAPAEETDSAQETEATPAPEDDAAATQEPSAELSEESETEASLASVELALTADGAEDEDTSALAYIPTTCAIVTSDSAGGQQIVMESYLTSTQDTQQNIRPCDIIFVLDQSKWMNTDVDSGAQRAAIIMEIKSLLGDLAEPTTGGQHRVAIAGYGRINMPANTDPYNAAIYPGVQASGSGISLNTGYYTAGGFLSQNGWSDISQSAMSSAGLPQMSASYKAAMTYDTAFMTLSEADAVLNEDTMLAWYAGASRMDAGLTIAEQLAAIAQANDPNGDRDLIVCILASSLPIQNTAYKNLSTIRTAAVLAASEQLKAEDATIFAFGDYHASGKTISGTVQDTEATFDSVMEQVCSAPEYYYSFADFDSVTEALNEMMTQIVLVAADDAEQAHTVTVQELNITGEAEPRSITWQGVMDYYGSSAQSIIDGTMAQVAYYYFTGYDDDGSPTFEDEPYITMSVPLSDLVSGDSLTYDATLIPLPTLAQDQDNEANSRYGNKVSITIAAPVTVTYQWASFGAGYAPSNAALPEADVVALGTAHAPAEPVLLSGAYDEHYEFAGWYTDAACTAEYIGTNAIAGNMTVYGKWDKYVLVEYYWDIWDNDYNFPDDEGKFVYGETPGDYAPDGPEGYTFDGWYLDKAYTQPYEPGPLTEDIALYAKWLEPEPETYHVTYDGNGAEGADLPVDDADYLLGDTVTVAPAMTWEGYVFVQWNTAQDGTGALYAPEDTFLITEDTTLYAQWEAEPEATEPPQETPPADDFGAVTGVENLHPGLYALLTALALLLGAAALWGRKRRQ